MRGRLTGVVAALAALGCGGDGATGPGDVLEPGAYALSVAVGPMPGYRAGGTTYVGTVTLTRVERDGAAGTYALTRTFTPDPPCGTTCGPFVSEVAGEVAGGAWSDGAHELRVRDLEVRVARIGSCTGRERGTLLSGPVFAPFTACTIARE